MQYTLKELPPEFPIIFWAPYPVSEGSRRYRSIVACHNGLEIGYCHEGTGVFSIAGRLFRYRPGYVSVVPPMIPHSTWSRKGTHSLWSLFLTDPARLLGSAGGDYALFDMTPFSVPGFPNLLSPDAHPAISRLTATIFEEHERKAANYAEAIRASVLALLVELSRLAGDAPASDAAVRVDWIVRIRPALRRIQNNFADPITVDALAALCHMGKRNFHRTFKRVMGKGPYEYLTAYRVARACLDLTEHRKSVESIAWDSGFATVSGFVRKFKDSMGMAPATWAGRQKKAP